jgi:hypothetical protein
MPDRHAECDPLAAGDPVDELRNRLQVHSDSLSAIPSLADQLKFLGRVRTPHGEMFPEVLTTGAVGWAGAEAQGYPAGNAANATRSGSGDI